MSPLSWMVMVPVRASKAKENLDPDIRCPQCSELRRIVRHGHYQRYRYESHERMAVARYACRNPDCPRRTFSVLPHSYLPVVRMPLCLLLALYRQHVAKTQAINELARKLRHGWNTIRRAVCLARRILHWCGQEIRAEAMPWWPCHADHWPAFSRAFSWAFLPRRFLAGSINTIR